MDSGCFVLVHNECVAEGNGFKAIVNPNNETEAPHAHILKDNQRVAKLYADGSVKGNLGSKGEKFVRKFREVIFEGISRIYPKK